MDDTNKNAASDETIRRAIDELDAACEAAHEAHRAAQAAERNRKEAERNVAKMIRGRGVESVRMGNVEYRVVDLGPSNGGPYITRAEYDGVVLDERGEPKYPNR